MAILIDTNVLLRSVQPSHPLYATAVRAIERLLTDEEQLCIAIQNVAEFWNAMTRPISYNGLGFTVENRVSGVQVHDARLVAVMMVHGIKRLVTFNVQDFVRFSEIEAIHPELIV